MKKFLPLIFFTISFSCAAQQTKPAVKPMANATPLKNALDSASYAIGIGIANFYGQQGVPQLNTDLISRAILDVFNKKQVLLNDDQANNTIMDYLGKIEMEKAKPVIEESEKFLTENQKRPGVLTTSSGLQYEILKKGLGTLPSETDTVLCHYKGQLLNGEEFENSYDRGEPVSFQVKGVIRGWTEALQLMPVGSIYKLYIPHYLAYGTTDRYPIPGGSVLIFEVELLEVK
ncbi:MAG: FKBP-type peptidyl-prolyl cis-trans isomerase [Chitinophagaceae bacterium]|nr:FKBP-type peptidyl-prolyl cis-trans isomerase [Chitinophagaceae bacterium]